MYKLSSLLGEKLLAKQWIVTCAESCTGGLVAKVITDMPGSSAYFEQSVVTYSDFAKQEMLGVSVQTLQRYGAVSEPVAREMVQGILKLTRANLAIAVSGIAGPDGGSSDKPVGTVCFAVADSEGRCVAYTCYFTGNRETVRYQAAEFALRVMCDEFL